MDDEPETPQIPSYIKTTIYSVAVLIFVFIFPIGICLDSLKNIQDGFAFWVVCAVYSTILSSTYCRLLRRSGLFGFSDSENK